ncbi:MAG: hypothetical protein HYZ54_01395 [Ignavibacteriae bacterium]|nr:hypothetical protein [Ignavibacteriota bacterium]
MSFIPAPSFCTLLLATPATEEDEQDKLDQALDYVGTKLASFGFQAIRAIAQTSVVKKIGSGIASQVSKVAKKLSNTRVGQKLGALASKTAAKTKETAVKSIETGTKALLKEQIKSLSAEEGTPSPSSSEVIINTLIVNPIKSVLSPHIPFFDKIWSVYANALEPIETADSVAQTTSKPSSAPVEAPTPVSTAPSPLDKFTEGFLDGMLKRLLPSWLPGIDTLRTFIKNTVLGTAPQKPEEEQSSLLDTLKNSYAVKLSTLYLPFETMNTFFKTVSKKFQDVLHPAVQIFSTLLSTLREKIVGFFYKTSVSSDGQEVSIISRLAEKYLKIDNIQGILQQVLSSVEDVIKIGSEDHTADLMNQEPEKIKDQLIKSMLKEETSFADYEKNVEALVEKGLNNFIDTECPELGYFSKIILKRYISKHLFGAFREAILPVIQEEMSKANIVLKDGDASKVQKHLNACADILLCRLMENLAKVWLQEKAPAPNQLDSSFSNVMLQVGPLLGSFVEHRMDTDKVKDLFLTKEQREDLQYLDGLGVTSLVDGTQLARKVALFGKMARFRQALKSPF